MTNKRSIVSISLSLVIHFFLFIVLLRLGVQVKDTFRVSKLKEEITVITTSPLLRDDILAPLGFESKRNTKSHIRERVYTLVPRVITEIPSLKNFSSGIVARPRLDNEKLVVKQKVDFNVEAKIPQNNSSELPMPQAGRIVKIDSESITVKASGARGEEERNGLPVILWQGRGRSLKSAYPIHFPQIIKRIGRDVDVEAKIVVAAGGNVIDVKITRSSGYEEVDRIVESALRRYLFSADPNEEQSIGKLKVHFILKPEE